MDKKTVGIVGASVMVAIVVWTAFLWTAVPTLFLWSNVGVDLESKSIHCTVRFYQNGELFYEHAHPGNVTDIGDNMTLFWAFGDTDFSPVANATYTTNVTYISIGDKGTLNEQSTKLPGEWNRTSATIEDEVQSQLNLTCTFYPDDQGPYTADCIGLNWLTSGDDNLWAFDEFNEVTNIDETFTINVEFQVSVSHS